MATFFWIVAAIALINALRLKINQRKDAKRRAEMIERGVVAAAKAAAHRNEKNFPNTLGGRKAAEREWCSK